MKCATNEDGAMNRLKNQEVLYPELSYKIIGAAMDVHNQIGPGGDEEAYHLALLHALHKKGLCAESKLRGLLKNRNQTADIFELDILVENEIILELKHLLGRFDPSHYIQRINYLKFWKKNLGILINFGLDRLQCERVPFTPRTGPLRCDSAYEKFAENNPDCAKKIKTAFSEILKNHGLGGTNVYRNLFSSECHFQNSQCARPSINLLYDSTSLGEKEVDAFRIDLDALVSVTAMSENTSAVHLARMLSYLHQTGTPHGILANFGTDKLDLRHVTP
jgi:GxxExxY protein